VYPRRAALPDAVPVSTAGGGISVALVNPSFWPEVQRGTERIMGDLASDLARAGHHPHVVTSHPGRPSTSTEYGFPVSRSWRPPESPLRARGFQPHIGHLPFTYRALTHGDHQIAHAFYPTDAVAAAQAARGRPTVFSYMGLPTRPVLSSRRLTVRFVRGSVTDADAVVSLSHAAARGLERWLGVTSRVIYPAVDLDHFSPGGERAAEPTVVCAASSDDARKRVDLLARAFVRVRSSRPTARLRLLKPSDPEVERELSDLADGIEFYRYDEADQIVAEFRSAWVSVLPSYAEAFGLVLPEALACGTPVVGTDDGGIPEIIDRPEIGRLFGRDDGEGALADAILASLELNEDPSTAGACRERAGAFGRERSLQAHLDLYRELLSSA
jgi:glycosyltransferase involved in cell wall biosynthesis